MAISFTKIDGGSISSPLTPEEAPHNVNLLAGQYTLLMSYGSGTPVAISGTGFYTSLGPKQIILDFHVVCTDPGTATGYMTVSLPFPAVRGGMMAGICSETGTLITFQFIAGQSYGFLRKSDGNIPVGPNLNFYVNGVYERT
jgi:hypothetical protein